jgi:hypothetical protein
MIWYLPPRELMLLYTPIVYLHRTERMSLLNIHTLFTLLRSVKCFTGNGTDSQKMQFLIAKVVCTGVHKSRASGRHPCLPAGFEPAMSAGERPQTHALDGTASGICIIYIKYLILRRCLTFEGVQSETCSMSPLQATRILKRRLHL